MGKLIKKGEFCRFNYNSKKHIMMGLARNKQQNIGHTVN